MMNRYLGLDYGEKRIGAAMSDPLQIMASPFEVISNDKNTLSRIKAIIEEYNISLVVVGKPINLKGEETPSTHKAMEFKKILDEELDVPVVLWDERFSTKSATNSLLEANVSRAKRKQVVDKVAAVFILQGYMDSVKKR